MNTLSLQGHPLSRLCVLVFALLLVGCPLHSAGQACHLRVLLSDKPKASFSLTLYDSDTIPRRLKTTASKGVAEFNTDLKGPCYAELLLEHTQQPLILFLEASDIQVRFNRTQPEQSAVTGSRVNSQYRYLLEQCPDRDKECLTDALQNNPDQPYSPLLLYQLLQRAPLAPDQQQSLFSLLQGAALTAYPYHLLAARLQRTLRLQAGQPIPELIFTDANGKSQKITQHLDSLHANLILVGATWCDQCTHVASRLARRFPDLNLIRLDLDRERKGWDAPFMQELEVDHIPFLILLDNHGRILHYDLREWQLNEQMITEK